MERDPNTGKFVSGSTWSQNPSGVYQPNEQSGAGAPQQPRQRNVGSSTWSAPSAASCSRLGTTGGVMSLVGGVGIGAALMYLMDPDKGPQRRVGVLDAANRALEVTTDALGGAYETTAHALGSAGHAAWEAMPSAHDTRRGGRRLMRGAGALGSSAYESARSILPHRRRRTWLDSARSVLPHRHEPTWLESARSMVPYRAQRRERHDVSTGGATLAAVGCFAVGLGLMWLMDPQRGRGRRAWIGQKANRFLNETGSFMRATGRHLGNKAKGYTHEARNVMPAMAGGGTSGTSAAGSAETDESLAERVRSYLGRLGIAGSVGVRCENHRAVLTGCCVTDDVDRIVSTTRSVPGVSHVENQLDVTDRYPSGQTSA